MTLLRYVWASPGTFLGLLLAILSLLRGGHVKVVDGILEVAGRSGDWILRNLTPIHGCVDAITLGHVVIARRPDLLERLRTHEQVHVRQYERWGPFFIPAYLWFSAVAGLKGLDPYRDNPFEKEAFAAEELVCEV